MPLLGSRAKNTNKRYLRESMTLYFDFSTIQNDTQNETRTDISNMSKCFQERLKNVSCVKIVFNFVFNAFVFFHLVGKRWALYCFYWLHMVLYWIIELRDGLVETRGFTESPMFFLCVDMYEMIDILSA